MPAHGLFVFAGRPDQTKHMRAPNSASGSRDNSVPSPATAPELLPTHPGRCEGKQGAKCRCGRRRVDSLSHSTAATQIMRRSMRMQVHDVPSVRDRSCGDLPAAEDRARRAGRREDCRRAGSDECCGNVGTHVPAPPTCRHTKTRRHAQPSSSTTSCNSRLAGRRGSIACSELREHIRHGVLPTFEAEFDRSDAIALGGPRVRSVADQ